jgi:nitrite reductase/ring-hydroxylating ferredoxin subunit
LRSFHRVGSIVEIPPGTCKVVQFGRQFVAVFHVEDAFYAIDHECPHAGGPLGCGALDGAIVRCPWHDWAFDVMSGRCPTSPDLAVATFPVRIVADEVQVEIDDESPSSAWDW